MLVIHMSYVAFPFKYTDYYTSVSLLCRIVYPDDDTSAVLNDHEDSIVLHSPGDSSLPIHYELSKSIMGYHQIND